MKRMRTGLRSFLYFCRLHPLNYRTHRIGNFRHGSMLKELGLLICLVFLALGVAGQSRRTTSPLGEKANRRTSPAEVKPTPTPDALNGSAAAGQIAEETSGD